MKLKELVDTFDNEEDFIKAVNNQLIALAEANPNFCYTYDWDTTCSYSGPAKFKGELVGPDCNGCIFGQALQNLGWSDKEEMNSSSLICSLCLNFADAHVPRYWSAIQKQQDMGKPWGQVLDNYRHKLTGV